MLRPYNIKKVTLSITDHHNVGFLTITRRDVFVLPPSLPPSPLSLLLSNIQLSGVGSCSRELDWAQLN